MRCAAASLALLAGGVCLAGTASSPPAIELARFVVEVETIADRVEAAGRDAAALEAIRASLPRSWPVRVGDRLFDVPAASLNDALGRLAGSATSEEARTAVRARLLTMSREAASLLQPAQPGATDARGRLASILARSEFRDAGPPGPIQKLLDRLLAWLDRIVGAFAPSRQLGWSWSEALVWLGIGCGVLLMAGWVAATLGHSTRSLALSLEAPPSAEARAPWGEEAVTAGRAGRYRDAVRCAYWAAVGHLGESGVWAIETGRTHREYLRLLPMDHGARPAMAAVTSCFEKVCYGGREATVEEYRETMGQLERIGCFLPWNPATDGS